jgi:putative ABC transport system permease protein
MSTATLTSSFGGPARAGTGDGGVPARRAVIRWAWRLFRREWSQQLLVLGLLTVAVAAMIWGAGVATNTPPPAGATFGTATAAVSLPGTDPRLTAEINAIQRRYGPVEVIENQALRTGSTQSVELRAQDPAGRFGRPLLALDSGHYPAGPGQVALTSQVAALYDLKAGGTWHADGRSWLVTGIAENPTDLNDEFALVAPGQVTAPTQVTVLLNVPPGAGQNQNQIRPGPPPPVFAGLPADATVALASQVGNKGIISPATIVLAVAVLGLVFIGLVSVAGFTVMAQRRLRALGMLAALGATERNVRLVMTASGAAVGLTAAVIGAVLGFGAWFAYVPSLETDTAHRIDPLNLPWWAIAAGVALAVLTSVLAARRPARTMARVPVVAALSGRPAAPKGVRRSAVPGVALVVGGVACLLFSGGWGGTSGLDALLLLGGLVGIIAGSFLLAPACVTVLTAGAGPRVPVAVRIALRDLVRQRARSGAAVAAVSFAVFLAMLIGIVASVRFSDVLDYAGQNLTTSQLIMYTQDQGPNAAPGRGLTPAQTAALQAKVDAFAATLHAQYVLPLDTVNGTLQQQGRGNNNFSGTLYVATPALLADFGIRPSQIDPGADILSMRPGLGGVPDMQLLYGDLGNPQATLSAADNPKIQQVAALPSGTSAPNTVITLHAIRQYQLRTWLDGWFIQAPQPLTSAQISSARQIAANAGVTAETKSGELGLGQISDGATVLGLVIALGVLVLSVGLVRSETSGDLRTLAATGASSQIRRTITGATAGAIGLLGAVLGAAGATAAGVAWARSTLSMIFGDFPVPDLLALLVGLPLAAAVGGWLLAGRQPQFIARQPLE